MKLRTFGIAAIALAALAAAPAKAQDWPQRNVRVLLPFGAGSATDVAARLMSDKLSAKWGKPIVIENRPGADGLIAINQFLSANDDHVLLYASSASFLAHPYTQEKLPYNLERDLAPIAQVSNTLLSAGASAASGIKTIGEFLKQARANPEKINAAGAAGLPEFTVDAFIKSENLKITKVPYRDVVQAGRDLGEDRIQFLLSSYAVVRPLVEAGKVTILALGSLKRSPLLPNIPSVAEAGYPGLAVETTAGFYGPRTMPLEQRQRVGAAVVEALADKTIVERISQSGQDVVPGGPDVLAATIKRQVQATENIAKVLGLQKKN
jgi:tripartite-type tricarboxylate transporter receptor subunit TctC